MRQYFKKKEAEGLIGSRWKNNNQENPDVPAGNEGEVVDIWLYPSDDQRRKQYGVDIAWELIGGSIVEGVSKDDLLAVMPDGSRAMEPLNEKARDFNGE